MGRDDRPPTPTSGTSCLRLPFTPQTTLPVDVPAPGSGSYPYERRHLVPGVRLATDDCVVWGPPPTDTGVRPTVCESRGGSRRITKLNRASLDRGGVGTGHNTQEGRGRVCRPVSLEDSVLKSPPNTKPTKPLPTPVVKGEGTPVGSTFGLFYKTCRRCRRTGPSRPYADPPTQGSRPQDKRGRKQIFFLLNVYPFDSGPPQFLNDMWRFSLP